MSSTGILIILVGIFILFNADKLASVMKGQLKLNTTGFNWVGRSSSGTF